MCERASEQGAQQQQSQRIAVCGSRREIERASRHWERWSGKRREQTQTKARASESVRIKIEFGIGIEIINGNAGNETSDSVDNTNAYV